MMSMTADVCDLTVEKWYAQERRNLRCYHWFGKTWSIIALVLGGVL